MRARAGHASATARASSCGGTGSAVAATAPRDADPGGRDRGHGAPGADRPGRSARARSARFGDVRKLANSFVFEFHDAIRDLPGSTPARQLVVKKGLEYLDSLAQEAGGDPVLQLELADAYEKVGDVQGSPLGANMGDTAGAIASYRKEVAIREALSAARARRPGDRARPRGRVPPAGPARGRDRPDAGRRRATWHARSGWRSGWSRRMPATCARGGCWHPRTMPRGCWP